MLGFTFENAVSFPRLFPRFDVATPFFGHFQGVNQATGPAIEKNIAALQISHHVDQLRPTVSLINQFCVLQKLQGAAPLRPRAP